MIKGKVIIDFEADAIGKCNWNLAQDGEGKLENEELITLLEHVIMDLLPED